MFMKNLSIAGGFLLLAITGPGAFSIDRVLNKKCKHTILSENLKSEGISPRFCYLKEATMGQLVDGVWHDTWYDTKSTGGRFKRSVSAFRNWLTADGRRAQAAKPDSLRKKTVTICTFSLACHGRIAP
ncbi:glutathione S-transferase [Klebsiella grimontii]|uniref:Glutathione S-transferase n=1 Tax=Klebsiella grimontii TaxID=2058152 RepID=A0A7H4NW75_9ENTR|nr:glutathione S-transferase [Klebsiella grimontii]